MAEYRVVLTCNHCGHVPSIDVRLGELCTNCGIGGYTISKREPLAASVPNTGTALSEEERATIDKARVWLGGDFRGHVPRLDELLAIIDRLSSAPSRGSESDVDPEQAACARCGLPKREHRMGYAAHRCAFYALTVAPLVTESAGGTNG